MRSFGWNIVKYILLKHKVEAFKVIRADLKMSDDPEQRGKDITIYAGYDRHLNVEAWQAILAEITTELVAHEIQPGYKQTSSVEKPEKNITGSIYFSYRYFDEVHQVSMPWPRPDPMKVIDLSNIVHVPYSPVAYSSAGAAAADTSTM